MWGQFAEGWLKCFLDLTKLLISPVLHLSWGSHRTSAVFEFKFFGLGIFSGFSLPEELLEQRVLVRRGAGGTKSCLSSRAESSARFLNSFL